MTTGAKVAIILGSATLLIGGGIGVYFLTRKKETTITTNGGSSTTTSGNKVQDTVKKVGETADTLKTTTESLKNLGSAIGSLFKKDEEEKQSATGEGKMSQKEMLKNYGVVTC